MTDYRAATGHDIVLGSLTVLDPQPKSTGLDYTRKTFAADGTPVYEGPYVELMWDIVETATQYTTILGYFGLSSAESADVTVYIRDEKYAYARYNGVAIRPSGGDYSQYFIRDVKLVIRNLTLSS